MKTPIFCEYGSTSWANNAARYAPLVSGGGAAAYAAGNASTVQTQILVPGTFSRLHVRLATAIKQGQYLVELYKNNVATGLKATITPTSQLADDLVTTVSFAADDLVHVVVTPSGAPDTDTDGNSVTVLGKTLLSLSLLFEATTQGKSQSFARASTSTGGGNFMPGVAQGGNGPGSLDIAQAYAPGGLTLDALGVAINSAPGTGNARTFQFYVGPAGALVATGPTLTFADAEGGAKKITGLNIAVPAGQYYAIVETVTGTPATTIRRMTVATTPSGTAVAVRTYSGSISTSADTSSGISGNILSANQTDGQWYSIAPVPLTIKSLRTEISAAPGSGKSRNVVLRKEGVDTPIVATLGATDTAATVTQDYEVPSGSLIYYSSRPQGGTNATNSWSKNQLMMVANAPATGANFTPTDRAGQVWEGIRAASSMTLRGGYSGSPTSIQTRLVDANGDAVAGFDWASTPFGNGTYSRTLNAVPIGGPYRQQVREGSTGAVTTSALPQYVGAVVLDWGQSQRERHYTFGLGDIAPVGNPKATVVQMLEQKFIGGTATFFDANTQRANIGSGIMQIVNDWWAATGIPIMIVKVNYEGSSIGTFIDNEIKTSSNPPATWGRWDFVNAMIVATQGQATIVTMMQGTSDASAPAG